MPHRTRRYTPEPGHEKVPLQLLGELLASGKDEYQGKEGESGEPQDLIIDTSYLPPLRIKDLHYIELSDVASFPFPSSIKENLQEVRVGCACAVMRVRLCVCGN
jgi:hypothetical protein